MAPAGQLWSTVDDLAQLGGVPGRPGPGACSPPRPSTEMCAPVVISDLDAWTAGHGLGLQLWRRGERVYVGHGGSMPGYLAVLAVHRPSRTGVVAFANAYGLRGTGASARSAWTLLDAVLDARAGAGRAVAAGAPRRRPRSAELMRPLVVDGPRVRGPRWRRRGRAGRDPLTGPPVTVAVHAPRRPDRWRGRSGDERRRDPAGAPRRRRRGRSRWTSPRSSSREPRPAP